MRGEVKALLRVASALLLSAGAAAAQDSIPRVPRDTVRVPIPEEAVRADTLPDKPAPDSAAADTVPPDSTLPAPNFPEFPDLGAVGFAPGVWSWNAAELSRWHGLSLEDFLERVPGVLLTRGGSFGRPAGASPFGGGGGRLRIFLDGWELRAMNAGTPDLQRVPLADVVSLRVERGLGEVRVHVSTFRLPDRRPYAQLEGADGDFDTRILRPFFASTIGQRMVLQLGMDLVETDGFRRLENYASNTIFGRLSYQLRPGLGLQLDYRSSAFSIDPTTGGEVPGEEVDRSELMLRGAGRLGGVWLDGAVGRSEQSPAQGDSLVLPIGSTQAYLRAGVQMGAASLLGSARIHLGEEGSWAPDERELAVAGSFVPRHGLSAGGDLRHHTRGGEGGLSVEGWARMSLVGGLALFGSVASGERAIPFLRDSIREVRTIGGGGGLPGVPVLDTVDVRLFRQAAPTLSAFRAGGEWTRGSIRLGAAYVVHDLAEVAPYGTYYDAGIEPAPGGAISAAEGYASIPLPWDGFRVEGWFMTRTDDERRPYLPKYMGQAAIEFHDFFRGGNLEPTIRLEVVGRSRAPLPTDDPEVLLESPRYGIANAFVQIRILDIRMFWRMENLFNNRSASDVGGTRLPGARQLYGVRWFFRN